MKATQKNICEVLGVHAKGLSFRKTKLHNGCRIRGFMARYALEDLLHTFHVYINKENEVVVLTKGRLSVNGRC